MQTLKEMSSLFIYMYGNEELLISCFELFVFHVFTPITIILLSHFGLATCSKWWVFLRFLKWWLVMFQHKRKKRPRFYLGDDLLDFRCALHLWKSHWGDTKDTLTCSPCNMNDHFRNHQLYHAGALRGLVRGVKPKPVTDSGWWHCNRLQLTDRISGWYQSVPWVFLFRRDVWISEDKMWCCSGCYDEALGQRHSSSSTDDTSKRLKKPVAVIFEIASVARDQSCIRYESSSLIHPYQVCATEVY